MFVTMELSQEESCTLDIISSSAAQTQRLGMQLGCLLDGGTLILLDGQLGAGKTTFTQGLAQGLAIHETVNSPTFTLLKEYMGQGHKGQDVSSGLALYHFDLYRLDDPEEMIDLGFEDYFYGTGVCVVEWADKAGHFWPAECLHLQMKVLNEIQRDLLFSATGARYCEILREFQKNAYATVSS